MKIRNNSNIRKIYNKVKNNKLSWKILISRYLNLFKFFNQILVKKKFFNNIKVLLRSSDLLSSKINNNLYMNFVRSKSKFLEFSRKTLYSGKSAETLFKNNIKYLLFFFNRAGAVNNEYKIKFFESLLLKKVIYRKEKEIINKYAMLQDKIRSKDVMLLLRKIRYKVIIGTSKLVMQKKNRQLLRLFIIFRILLCFYNKLALIRPLFFNTKQSRRRSKVSRILKYLAQRKVRTKKLYLQISATSKNNWIGFFDLKHNLVVSSSCKTSKIPKRLRTDLVKTGFLFFKLFKIYQNKMWFRNKLTVQKIYNKFRFISFLSGNLSRTSKLAHFLVKRFKVRLCFLKDNSGISHNGCRGSARRRKKNRGKNRFSKRNLVF